MNEFLQAAGGLGLFLLGMVILTDGLKAVAGDALHQGLARFTKTPLKGTLTGLISTACLQSSSASTVAAVGFVSARLITFKESLGLIYGANLGTTLTGWVIAFLGFKLKLGLLVLPLILLGALLRLFAKGKFADLGFALAGFGLIFVGVDLLQTGLTQTQGLLDPADFPPDTLTGSLGLFLLGLTVTLLTQSSAAGIAGILTLLHLGGLNLGQGLALLIGMDMGTTITAVLAALGGSVAAKRTALANVLYNLYTSLLGLLLIWPYLHGLAQWFPSTRTQEPELLLVSFHSLYNLIGIGLILPLNTIFAKQVKQILPHQIYPFTSTLDKTLLSTPSLAIAALKPAIEETLAALLHHLDQLLHQQNQPVQSNLTAIQNGLAQSLKYIDQIHLSPAQAPSWPTLKAMLHILDHMNRLWERAASKQALPISSGQIPELKDEIDQLSRAIEGLSRSLEAGGPKSELNLAMAASHQILSKVELFREKVLNQVVQGELSADEARAHLDAIRWLERVSRHLSHITLHLSEINLEPA